MPEERGDRLAVLAIPSDMGVADFCQFLGGYLAGVRQMRLVRRGDTPALCLVLLRFKDSAMAAGFYGDYNGRPVCTRRCGRAAPSPLYFLVESTAMCRMKHCTVCALLRSLS